VGVVIRVRPIFFPPATDTAVIDGHEFLTHGGDGARETARDGRAQGEGAAVRDVPSPDPTT